MQQDFQEQRKTEKARDPDQKDRRRDGQVIAAKGYGGAIGQRRQHDQQTRRAGLSKQPQMATA